MSDVGDLWKDYREEQAARRAKRVPKRIARLQSLLPFGFTMEERNQGYCWVITGPSIRLSYYPTHNRVQITRGPQSQLGWRSMTPERVADFCQNFSGASPASTVLP